MANGVSPGPPVLEASEGGGSPPKKELEVGRGVLGRRSESSREPLGLFGVSEGSLFPLEVVMKELTGTNVATSDGVSLAGEARELGG